MQVNTYLNFNGQCEEAFKFYEKCLGGKIQAIMPFGGSPMENQVPPEWHTKVLHAQLKVGNNDLMGSDAPPDRYVPPQGFSVSLSLESTSDAERIYKDLSEGGSVKMPLQQTFWAERFAMLTDRFGIPWIINCEKGQ